MSEQVQIVKVFGTEIWCESDFGGSRHVMMRHEVDGEPPFCYASFHYNYGYTSNSGTRAAAEELAKSLGAAEPVEWRQREFKGFEK